MVCCSIPVPAGDFGAAPLITDFNIDVAATHTWVGDLTIKLFGPGGQFLAMLNRPGSNVADDGTDTPYGYGFNWTGATVTFDDQRRRSVSRDARQRGQPTSARRTASAATCPAPDTAGGLANLAGFNGSDPRGTWSMCMGDGAGGDTGTFNSATLSFVTNDSPTTTQIVTTDANGDYTAVVTGTTATIDVSGSRPRLPRRCDPHHRTVAPTRRQRHVMTRRPSPPSPAAR